MSQSMTEAREVLGLVRDALDLSHLKPPRGLISGSFREVGKKLSFGRGGTPYALADTIGYLCAYGYHQRAVDASDTLGRIDPVSWDINYNYVRSAIHTSYFFAIRAGEHEQAARLEPILAMPGAIDIELGRERYVPNERVTNGSMLDHPFLAPAHNLDQSVKPEDWMADSAVMDLRKLATMWIFGGSDEWPRERIMAQVDSTIENLHKLKGWEPW